MKVFKRTIAITITLVSALTAPPATARELTFLELYRDGVDGVDGLNGAHAVAVSSDGENAYVASDFPGDAIAVFERNPTDGRLTFIEAHRDGDDGVDGLDGAVAVTVSPDGKNVYVCPAPMSPLPTAGDLGPEGDDQTPTWWQASRAPFEIELRP